VRSSFHAVPYRNSGSKERTRSAMPSNLNQILESKKAEAEAEAREPKPGAR